MSRRASRASRCRDGRNDRATPARCRSSAAPRRRCRDRCAASGRRTKSARPARPDGIDQDVEACGLDQPARMADEGEPHLAAIDARRRRVGMGARRPFRPDRALPAAGRTASAAPAPSDFGGDAVGIVEIAGRRNDRRRGRNRSSCGTYQVGRQADRGSAPGEHSQTRRRVSFMDGIGLKTADLGKMGSAATGLRKTGLFSKFP